MADQSPLLSIIIPAYNEEERLPKALDRIKNFAAKQKYQIEVIVIDNNSTDSTGKIAKHYSQKYDFILHGHQPIQGKGAAVREGILKANGDFLFICDADLSMPIDEINRFLEPDLQPYDIAIGSREIEGANRYNEPWRRHITGRIFNWIVQVLAVRKISDTQCGFKCFHKEIARKLFRLQVIDGWAFDVEVLYLAQLFNYRVVEVPIDWYFDADSRVSLFKDSFSMLFELFSIRYNRIRGLYTRHE